MNLGVQEFCVVLYSKLSGKIISKEVTNFKIYYQKENRVISINLESNRSYIIFGSTVFEEGSNLKYFDTENIANIAINTEGTISQVTSMYRSRTIGDGGGGCLTCIVVSGTGSNASAYGTVYGYINRSEGYQKVGAKLIAVPIA